MDHVRELPPSQQKLLKLLREAKSPRSYKELAAESGYSMITCQRALKALRKARLVRSHYDGVSVYWRTNNGTELPTIGTEPINEWLENDSVSKMFTENNRTHIRERVALLYLQPLYLMAAGKSQYINAQREELIEFAKHLDYQAGILRHLAHTLFQSTEDEYKSWGQNKDYDPRLALKIVALADPQKYTKEQVKLLLSAWEEKRVKKPELPSSLLEITDELNSGLNDEPLSLDF